MALGYKAADADKAVRQAVESLGPDSNTEDLVRAAFSQKG
jgi:Holliday junction resolvasome RuvABC DNA-binding subunit